MSQGKVVLMACGSFSPPTYMHLRMFEIARDYLHSSGLASVVGGIVSPVHDAYGKKDLVAAQHRIAMLKLALRSSSWIKVSEWETQQSGWTRTRLSMQYHQDTLNGYISSLSSLDPDPPSWLPDDVLNVNSIDEPDNLMDKLHNGLNNRITIKLLCGADLLESFATPGLWSDEDLETIVGRHGLVVVSRAGSDPGRFIYESDMLYKHRNNVTLVTNYIANEVSSTVIRRLVRRGESAKYLTDDGVLGYVRRHSLYGATPHDTEYNLINDLLAKYDKRSPQDVLMASPEETSFKNILISIRDKPTIVDETITVKRARKTNFLMPNSHTDSVSPVLDTIKPKMAYIDKVPASYVPGKAVKIVSDATQHAIKDEKVSLEPTYRSLDSYLSKDDADFDIYKRRVSESNVEKNLNIDNVIKKRCSSTIRKLRPEDMKKSKSEVSKLCDKVKSIKLKDRDSGRNYKTRSCNDIVRLILTKHGIHVISDTEAIV
ncbi:nicotinamide/nicotinic acid mononucleotide adenylyltransferase 1 [Ostrinia nubilalis]|uniref:nicotinamide/nicotinic acid mononucleotide adenylyltransferase 1 n=1 Tax=Ostrinia nubilalis TaxID=29057 RepID=UPI0030823F04